MDPNATLQELLRACRENDPQAAYDSATNLADWIDKGGFLPNVVMQNGEHYIVTK